MTNSSLAVNQTLLNIGVSQGAGNSSQKSKAAEGGTKFSDHLKKAQNEDHSDRMQELSAGSAQNEPANQSNASELDDDEQSTAADKGESSDAKIYAANSLLLSMQIMPQPGQMLSAENQSDPALVPVSSEEAALPLQLLGISADPSSPDGSSTLSNADSTVADAIVSAKQSTLAIIKTAAADDADIMKTAQNAPLGNAGLNQADVKGMRNQMTANAPAAADNGQTVPDSAKIIIFSPANAGSDQKVPATDSIITPTDGQVPETDLRAGLSHRNQNDTDSSDQSSEEPDLHLNLKVGTAHSENVADKAGGAFSGVLTEAAKSMPDQGTAAGIPEPAKVIEQIVKQIEVNNQQNNSEITIQLKPEHLGKMMIQLSLEEGKVTARFVTDSQEVKNLLDTNLGMLKQNLEANGIKVEKTEVSYQLNGGEDFNQHFSGSGQEMNQQTPNRGGHNFSFSDQPEDPEDSYVFSYMDADSQPADTGESSNQLNYLI